MAFGTGSAIAHRAVDAVMGGGSSGHRPVEEQTAPGTTPMSQTSSFDNEGSSNPCTADLKAFQDVSLHTNSYTSMRFISLSVYLLMATVYPTVSFISTCCSNVSYEPLSSPLFRSGMINRLTIAL